MIMNVFHSLKNYISMVFVCIPLYRAARRGDHGSSPLVTLLLPLASSSQHGSSKTDGGGQERRRHREGGSGR